MLSAGTGNGERGTGDGCRNGGTGYPDNIIQFCTKQNQTL